MKQIFLYIFLLISLTLSAQRQLPAYNTAAGTLTQTGAGSGYVDVRINYSDQTGITTGSTVDNTCVLLYFNTDESLGYELPILSVTTPSATNPVVRVNITGFPALNGAINGQGVVYKKSSSKHFVPFVSNASNSLQQVIQEAMTRDIESALNSATDITKYVGSGAPLFTPTTNEPKLAQGLASPYPFYAYNGSSWVLVGSGGGGTGDTIATNRKYLTWQQANGNFVKGADKGLKITNSADTAQIAEFDFQSMNYRTGSVVGSDLLPINDGTNHVKIRVDSLISLVPVSNGLTKTGSNIELGGTLAKPTDVQTNTQSLSIIGTGSLNVGTNVDNGARLNITQTVSDSQVVEIRSPVTGNKPHIIAKDIAGNEKWRWHWGNDNFFMGQYAGASNIYTAYTDGSSNFAIGNGAFQSNIRGYANTAIGHSALTGYNGAAGGSNNSGNVAVGFQSLTSLKAGTGNTALGTDSGFSLDSLSQYNTIIGYHSGKKGSGVAVSQDNTIVGANAFLGFTTGSYNTGVGKDVLAFNNTGAYNTALGYQTLYVNQTGIGNTAVGTRALTSNTTASYITALGYYALYNNTSGARNLGLGYLASFSNTTGNDNVAIGTEALNTNVAGNGNTGLGYRTLYRNTAGNNTAIGYTTMFENVTGTNNVAIGNNGLTNNINGDNNIAIGVSSGIGTKSGSNNVYLGYLAGYQGNTTTVESNQLYIGNGVAFTNTWIKGDSIYNIGIGTITPAYKLDVYSRAGNPLRLQGLQQGLATDSIVTSNAGVLKRLSIDDVRGITNAVPQGELTSPAAATTTQSYTVTVSPAMPTGTDFSHIELYFNGVRQRRGAGKDYTITSSTTTSVTFDFFATVTEPVTTSDIFFVEIK